jgi:hypothetical protein
MSENEQQGLRRPGETEWEFRARMAKALELTMKAKAEIQRLLDKKAQR